MEYKYNIIGPDFDTADLITFHLDDVDIILPLPEHCSEYGERYIAPREIASIPSESWEKDDDESIATLLVNSNWLYLNELDNKHAFTAHFKLVVRRLATDLHSQSIPLNRDTFSNWALKLIHLWVEEQERHYPTSESFEQALKDWQVQETVDNFSVIERDGVQWLLATMEHVRMETMPQPFAFVPLNRTHSLQIYIELDKMSYSYGGGGSEIPRLEADAMILQFIYDYYKYIRIEYSDELRAEIQRQNSV